MISYLSFNYSQIFRCLLFCIYLMSREMEKIICQAVIEFGKSRCIYPINSQLENQYIWFRYTHKVESQRNYQAEIYVSAHFHPQGTYVFLKHKMPRENIKNFGGLVNGLNNQLQNPEHKFYVNISSNQIVGKALILNDKQIHPHSINKKQVGQTLKKLESGMISVLNKFEQEQIKISKIQPKQVSNKKKSFSQLKKIYQKINQCREKINQTISTNTDINSKILSISINPLIISQPNKQLSHCIIPKLPEQKQKNKEGSSQTQVLTNQTKILLSCQIIKEQIDEKWKPSGSNSLGIVMRMDAQFYILDSLYKQTNQITKQQIGEHLKLIKDYLIKKTYKQKEDSHDSFMTEIWALLYMRKMNCESIGQYYLKEIVSNISEVQFIYSKYYRLTLEEFISNRSENKYFFEIVEKILEGLSFFNDLQFCHRDLKMQNIMIDKSSPKIIDFGSSITFRHKDFHPHLSGKLRSTRGYYISPHQIRDQAMIERLISSDPLTHKSYQEMSAQERQANLYEIVARHSNFDVFSIGRIIEIYFEQIRHKNIINPFLVQKIQWIINVCQSVSPLHRPNIEQLLKIWKLMRICWQTAEKYQ